MRVRVQFCFFVLSAVVAGSGAAPSSAQEGGPESGVATQPDAGIPDARTPTGANKGGGPPPPPEPGKPTERAGELFFTWGQIALSAALIGLLLWLFILLFNWEHRRERSSYFGVMFRGMLEQIEFARLVAPLEERWNQGAYAAEIWRGTSPRAREWHDSNAPPEPAPSLKELASKLRRDYELHSLRRGLRWMVEAGVTGGSRKPGGSTGLSGDPWAEVAEEKDSEAQADNRKFDHDLQEFQNKLEAWADKASGRAWAWYQEDRELKRADAQSQAKLGLQIDFAALRGRGQQFVLEFTAIVVIIFAAVILGILKILDNQQIGTLLAAIAGYVLGRAATRGGSPSQDAPAAKGENAPNDE